VTAAQEAAALAQSPPAKPNKCANFIYDFFIEPLSGEGVTLNISDDTKARSFFYWEYILLW